MGTEIKRVRWGIRRGRGRYMIVAREDGKITAAKRWSPKFSLNQARYLYKNYGSFSDKQYITRKKTNNTRETSVMVRLSPIDLIPKSHDDFVGINKPLSEQSRSGRPVGTVLPKKAPIKVSEKDMKQSRRDIKRFLKDVGKKPTGKFIMYQVSAYVMLSGGKRKKVQARSRRVGYPETDTLEKARLEAWDNFFRIAGNLLGGDSDPYEGRVLSENRLLDVREGIVQYTRVK